MEIIGDSLYFIGKDISLVRLDTKRLKAAFDSKNKEEMLSCEEVVCQNVETIGLDSVWRRIVVISPGGHLFMADSPEVTLDLSEAAINLQPLQGQAKEIEASDTLLWTAVGSYGGKILAAGINKTKKRLEYLLVDAVTMVVTDRLTVADKVRPIEVKFVQLTTIEGRLVAVCCRFAKYVDILQVTGDRLELSSENQSVDFCGDKFMKLILSISRYRDEGNVFLLGGHFWLKKLELKSV